MKDIDSDQQVPSSGLKSNVSKEHNLPFQKFGRFLIFLSICYFIYICTDQIK